MTSDRYIPPYSITPLILQTVEQIGECLGRLEVVASPSVTPHLRRNNRIKTVQASLEIEGNTLSLDQVTAVLNGKRILGSMREIQEVRNAFLAYEKLGSFDPFKVENLCAAHAVMMHGLEARAGHFRSTGVGIRRGEDIVHIAPPAERISELMTDLLNWLSTTEEHPLVASSVFHYEFEFIHPFMDGNGRLGRFWQTLILSHWKPVFSVLPIETIIRDQQKAYYAALRSSDNTGDSTIFVEFMLQALVHGLQENLPLTDQESDQESDQVKIIVKALVSGPKKAVELMKVFGLSHRPTFRKNYLKPAINGGFIEMTQPDKPQSRNQQYRLTEKGKRLVL